jgi:fibronectin type 3 domain-containing protein
LERKTLLVLFSLILGISLCGCGKKAPPVALESIFPEPVKDLRGWAKDEGLYLTWSHPSRNVDGTRLKDLAGFRVFRQSRPLGGSSCPDCPEKLEPVEEIDLKYPRGARLEGQRVWWQDSTAKFQNEYTYVVTAYNQLKTPSLESNRVKLSWDQGPTAVQNLSVKSEDRSLEISWDFEPRLRNGEALSDLAGFNIYRRGEGEAFGSSPLNAEMIAQSPHRDVPLVNGKRYEYEVRTVRNFNGTFIEGPSSPVVAGVPEKRTPPSAPTGLVGVIRNEEGKRGIELRWDINPEPDVAGYDLYRQEKDSDMVRVNSQIIPESYFFDASADPHKSYTYRLRAVDRSPRKNQSEFSQEIEATP